MPSKRSFAATALIVAAAIKPGISAPPAPPAASQPAGPKAIIAALPYFSPDGRYVALLISSKSAKPRIFESPRNTPVLHIYDTRSWKEIPRPSGRTYDVMDNDGIGPPTASFSYCAPSIREAAFPRFSGPGTSPPASGPVPSA